MFYDCVFTCGYKEFGVWDRDRSGNLIYTSLLKELNVEDLPNDYIWKVYIQNENVFFQSFNSIYKYNIEKKNVSRLHSISEPIFFLMNVDNELWIQGMQKGIIYKLIDDSLTLVFKDSKLDNTNIQSILSMGNDEYLICTSSKGIYKYDGHELKEWNVDLVCLQSNQGL